MANRKEQKRAVAKPDWVKTLVGALLNECDCVPNGWMTTHQIAEKIGLGPGQASRRIRALIQSGKLEKRTFRIQTARSGVYPIPHYAPIGRNPIGSDCGSK